MKQIIFVLVAEWLWFSGKRLLYYKGWQLKVLVMKWLVTILIHLKEICLLNSFCAYGQFNPYFTENQFWALNLPKRNWLGWEGCWNNPFLIHGVFFHDCMHINGVRAKSVWTKIYFVLTGGKVTKCLHAITTIVSLYYFL